MISFHAPLLFYAAARLAPIIAMFALYTSRKQGKLQRACDCGDSEIHGCKSGSFAPVVLHIELYGCRSWVSVPVAFHIELHVCKSWVSAPVVGFTGANPAFLPPSLFTLNFTGADRGFLRPSLDSRAQIRPFCHPSSCIDVVPNCGKSPLSSGCFAIRRGL